MTASHISALVAAFLANGGKVKRLPEGKARNVIGAR